MLKFFYLLFGLISIFFGLLSFMVAVAYAEVPGYQMPIFIGFIAVGLGARLVVALVRQLGTEQQKR
jgi:riboflavin transporter FmnP